MEIDIVQNGEVGGVVRGILQAEFGVLLAQHRFLVGRQEAHGFREGAEAGGPAIEEPEAVGGDGHLRDAEKAGDADEEEVAVDFLAHVFTEQRALEVGEDAGEVHD